MFVFTTKVIRKILKFVLFRIEYCYFKFIYKKQTVPVFAVKKVLLKDDSSTLSKKFNELFPDEINVKIAQADLFCDHVFDLLGSGPKKLSKDGSGYQSIDWHSDFKANYRWGPEIFYKDIKYGHIEGVDIKVPWELSRCQHLVILGESFLLSKNSKYAKEFENQILDWIKSNPVGFGVNWSCTMDVAIRAVNMLVGIEFFADYKFPGDFLNQFYTSMYEHGRFIRGHLEYSHGLTTNHYLSDLAGLLFVGCYCSFLKESKKWIRFSIRELEKEILKQVYPDGCDFEASTSYHRLVLEILFYSKLIAESAGYSFSKTYSDRLRKMFEFSLYCIKPNGRIPQIGDNDNGRFLIFKQREVLDHSYLLSLAACSYNDASFKMLGFGFDEEAFWTAGKDGASIYDQLPQRIEPLESKVFPDAGWYIMRHNDNYCFISCGRNGQNGIGGHAHNDKLSFELMLKGVDVVIDPGTYQYTASGELRNKFRSTGFHNVVQIDGFEQNGLDKGLFCLKPGVKCVVDEFNEKDKTIVFRAKCKYFNADLEHSREIIFNKDENNLTVNDRISGDRKFVFRVRCLLASNEFTDKLVDSKVKLTREPAIFSREFGNREETCALLGKAEGNSFSNSMTISLGE